METSRQIIFKKLHNTRDLGGMKTKYGQRVREGMLIRSGHLYGADEKDLEKIAALTEMLVDFRTEKERAEKPDPVLSGVEYMHIPIFESLTAGVTREKEADEQAVGRLMESVEKAKQYMCATYTSFVSNAYSVGQYEKFLKVLLKDHQKAVLWHCTAGKDRAGFASVIVQEILGIDREAIREPQEAKEALGYLFGAKEEYLDGLYAKVEELYGDFSAFVSRGLHMDESMQERMRRKFLE